MRLIPGQRVVRRTFVAAIYRPAVKTRRNNRVVQFRVERGLGVRVRTHSRAEEFIDQRRLMQIAKQVVVQRLHAIRSGARVPAVRRELHDNIRQRTTAVLKILRIGKPKADSERVDRRVVIRVVVVDVVPNRSKGVGVAGLRAKRCLHIRKHVGNIVAGRQRPLDDTINIHQRLKAVVRGFARLHHGIQRPCLKQRRARLTARNHRRVVRTRDGNNDVHGIGQAEVVRHRDGEGFLLNLALRQRLRRAERVVQLVDPLPGTGINLENAVAPGRTAGERQRRAVIHIRRNDRAAGGRHIAILHVPCADGGIRRTFAAFVIRTAQEIGIDAADKRLQLSQLRGIRTPALIQRISGQIAEQVVVQRLQTLRRRVRVAVIGRVLRDHVEQAPAGAQHMLRIDDPETRERLVHVRLVRTRSDVVVVEIIPHDGNRICEINALLALDRRKHRRDIGWRSLQRQECGVGCGRQNDHRLQTAAKSAFVNGGKIPGLGH